MGAPRIAHRAGASHRSHAWTTLAIYPGRTLVCARARRTGRQTLILTEDADVEEQLFKLLWLIETHYRGMVLADKYAADPAADRALSRSALVIAACRHSRLSHSQAEVITAGSVPGVPRHERCASGSLLKG